jgi:hypothetical protein
VRSTRRCAPSATPAPSSDPGGDDDRREDDRQHEDPEADRARLVGALDRPHAGPAHGLTPEPLTAVPVKLRLVPKLLFELRETLTHPHGHLVVEPTNRCNNRCTARW